MRTPQVQGAAASLAATYLRFVNLTSRLAFDPPDPYGKYIHLAPVIFTMWHGQHFMLPFARIFDFDVRVLISRHHDGEINARVAEKLGIRTIRGSTARDPSRLIEKGGMVGFLEMKAALEEGACVSMTADISNLAPRRAGLGIVALAKASGRAIIPVAYATSRRGSTSAAGTRRRSTCPSAGRSARSASRCGAAGCRRPAPRGEAPAGGNRAQCCNQHAPMTSSTAVPAEPMSASVAAGRLPAARSSP